MKVAVLMGGPSHEHEVSLRSGTQVAEGLRTAGHDVLEVLVAPARDRSVWEIAGARLSPDEAALFLRRAGVEVIFPALHGPYGEDGSVQGFLDVVGIPYVGSSLLGAAVSMDKEIAKALYTAHGIPTAQYALVHSSMDLETVDIGPRAVVKAVAQGSSFGLEIVNNFSELREVALRFLKEFGPPVLIEQFLQGREVTCGVIRDPDLGRLVPLPPTEIRPVVSDYFDYRAKYEPGGSEEITPAPISPEQTALVQELALKAHRALRLGSMSRTDFILTEDGPMALETNSIPGFTQTSLLPQEAAAAGITFPQLVDKLIRGSRTLS